MKITCSGSSPSKKNNIDNRWSWSGVGGGRHRFSDNDRQGRQRPSSRSQGHAEGVLVRAYLRLQVKSLWGR